MSSTTIMHPANRSNAMPDRTSNNVVVSSSNSNPNRPGSESHNNNKKKKKKNHVVITPIKTSLDRRMTVEKAIVDELLLVCGVIGTTTTGDTGNELVPVTDCLNWLQDLQRALRRDEDLYRPISLLMGKWKVVEQKLFPLVMTCRYDNPIVLTVVKILVILTKPLADNTKNAGRMIIDVASPKADPKVVKNLIKIRENALQQAEQLMEYKRLVTYHPSHHSSKRRTVSQTTATTNNKNDKSKSKTSGGTGLLSIFVSLLAEPLSKSGSSRTDADHLTIELVLHLIRNLLTAEPLLNTSGDSSGDAHQLHQEMISLFERELVLEILLVVGQEMESRENSQYNLLMMEILHHMLKGQDPTFVAKSSSLLMAVEDGPMHGTDSSTLPASVITNPPPTREGRSSSLLASKLRQEQSQLRNMTALRHGHFAGTWMRQQADGRKQFVGATVAVQGNTNGSGGGSSQQHHLTQARRKNRLAEPFIGSGKTLLAHSRMPVTDRGPVTKRANQTLHTFCQRFMADCYGPFMKSIKNEFRRDSVRLEEGDKVVFFRLVWFFAQWWRVSRTTKTTTTEDAPKNDNGVIGRLIITMDVFTFNLVVTATETFYTHKKFNRLAQTVALYSEMMHLLYDMYTSTDSTEQEMAIGLIDRIFNGQEALDRLPKLLSRWTPGTHTREYLCDLAELAYVTLKLLETNTKRGTAFVKGLGGGKKDPTVSTKIAKMLHAAAEFDVKGYLLKKVVSNHMITMYGYLLGQYKVNATSVNHRILSMFLRVMRLEIAVPEIADSDTPINPLGTKRVTMEPILYNIQLIMVMEQILNDATIRTDKSFEPVLQFCTSLMYKFWTAAESNPLLYVECLFRHSTPHRYCESVTNLYVDEELRMLALRDILRAEHERELAEYHDNNGQDGGMNNRGNDPDDDDDDNDDDEVEFTGDIVRPVNEDDRSGRSQPSSSIADVENVEECGAENSTQPAHVADEETDGIDEVIEDSSAKTTNKSFNKRAIGDINEEISEDINKDVEENMDKDINEDVEKNINEAINDPESSSDSPSPTKRQQPPAKRARLNTAKDDDSSDDDIDFGTPSIAPPIVRKSKTKFSINDDSDDE